MLFKTFPENSYQQYKDHYTQLGKKAMQDTMGQAAALTGGYGSSYTQNVGQQAYISYMQQLGDVVPGLYKLAYDRYQDQGDQLYKTYQSWGSVPRAMTPLSRLSMTTEPFPKGTSKPCSECWVCRRQESGPIRNGPVPAA